MTVKKKPAPAAPKPRHSVDVGQTANDDSFDAAIARTLTKPEVSAALTIQKWHGSVSEVNSLSKELAKQIDDVNNGSMKRPEAMLLAQAHTLDELFNNLARRAQEQQSIQWFEGSLRLALKAQGQCRATLETLTVIKNPPIIFAKQANISNGHQQINNGVPAHAGEIKNQTNELLEHTHGERLDSGTKGETISIDSELATVG